MEAEWDDDPTQTEFVLLDSVRKGYRGICGELHVTKDLRKANSMTKEQWKIAYWKLRRKYRKENLNFNLQF